jgi:hypothetical protein
MALALDLDYSFGFGQVKKRAIELRDPGNFSQDPAL